MEIFDNSTALTPEKGFLVIRASTAGGIIPLEGAAVSIRGEAPENSGIIYSTTTNSDGLTEKIALPTPPKMLSEDPKGARPYSVYNIDVFKDGYIPVYFNNVPVFSNVISIQPAIMVPASNAEWQLLSNTPIVYNEYENPEL